MRLEPYLSLLVALHGVILLMAHSGSPLPWVGVGTAAGLGAIGAWRRLLAVPRGYALVVNVVVIAWFTGGLYSTITLWLAAAALVYPAIVPLPGPYLAWGIAWYLPLVAASGTMGDAIVRASLVAGGGAVAWGLGSTTQQLVGEKEQTESELRDAQGRFAAAFEHASSGMVMFNTDGTVFRVNQAMADFLGRSLPQLAGVNLLDFFHPEDQPAVKAKFSELVAGALWSFQDELRCIHDSGKVMWSLVGIGLITGPEGAPMYFFAHFQDITSRVATENSLRANEEHYRTLFGQSPIPIWEVDYTAVEEIVRSQNNVDDMAAFLRIRIDLIERAFAGVKIVDANDAAMELFGSGPESDPRAPFPLLMPTEGSLDALVEQLVAVFDGSDRSQGSISTRSTDGTSVEGILHWAAPVVNDARDLSRVVLAFADFSEARQARMALQRIEERLRAVVSASPILLFALDANGVFTLSEGQALQALRLSPGEAVGRSAFELFRDSPELLRAVRGALGGDSLTTSAEVRGRVLDVRLGPMWEAGNVAGVIGVGNDVTERLRASDQLEQLVRSKDQFVASVSHELRTPLTAVVGFAQELNSGLDRFGDEEIAMLVSLIAQQSIEVADLVEDLLVAARSDVDEVSVNAEAVELWEQVELVAAALPGVPSGDVEMVGDPVKVFADPIRLRQILRNLMSNARRYGGDRLVIEAIPGPTSVEIHVKDDGEGIPVLERAKIFDPYFRGDRGNAAGSSVGLGLTVSHQLATRMDGELIYRYDDGWSSFVLTLPAG